MLPGVRVGGLRIGWQRRCHDISTCRCIDNCCLVNRCFKHGDLANDELDPIIGLKPAQCAGSKPMTKRTPSTGAIRGTDLTTAMQYQPGTDLPPVFPTGSVTPTS